MNTTDGKSSTARDFDKKGGVPSRTPKLILKDNTQDSKQMSSDSIRLLSNSTLSPKTGKQGRLRIQHKYEWELQQLADMKAQGELTVHVYQKKLERILKNKEIELD